ncbi:MAG: hypothetical protein DMD82_06910 [Candidatus Rokuibacteriota bacterium]|nr:MAG: hypothetical protein DMD82_06910 [Candidatus Rokubacteria bacterium]
MILTGFGSAGRLPALITAIVLLLCCAGVGVAQKKDEVTAEQRKLQETQKQLREQRERAAEARKKEVSLLADLEQIDLTLARKRSDVAHESAESRARSGPSAATSAGSRAGKPSSRPRSAPGSARSTRSRPRVGPSRWCSAATTPSAGRSSCAT